MKLKKIILTNYKQHRNREVDLDGTLCAVIGHNGCGKSNMLGAIQFALSGEQPGFTKQQLVSWGENDGRVKLEFEHEGKNIVITRNLVSPAVTLVIDGEETITGAKKVEEALSTRLNLDKDLMRQVVFVRQSEVDSILFTDPRQRELSFQRLMGIGDAAKIHKDLGTIIQGLDKPENFDEAINQARFSLSELTAKLDAQSTIIDNISNKLKSAPSAEQLQASIESRMQEIQTRREAEQTSKLLMQAIENKTAAENARAAATIPEASDETKTALEVLLKGEKLDAAWSQAMVMKLRMLKTVANSRSSDMLTLQQQELELKQIQSTDAGEALIPEKQGQLDRVTEQVNKLQGELNTLKPVMTAVQTLAAHDKIDCPMCGSSVDVDQISKYTTDRYTAIKGELDQAMFEQKEATLALQKITSAVTSKKHAEDAKLVAINAIKARLATYVIPEELEHAVTFENIDSYMVIVGEFNKMVTDAETAIKKLDADINTYTGHITVYKKQLDDANMKFNKDFADVDEATLKNDIQMFQYGLNTINELETSLATARGVESQMKDTISMTQLTLNTLEEKKSGDAMYRESIATLEKVRDWFHYSNGPHTMAATILEELNQTVNGFLEQFTAPFVVLPADEGIGFKCRFTDGRQMPETLPDASVLSGGQKVQLAVAFRMAVYCLFASKLGLLSLDEPTAYLDEANIGKFGDLLQAISKIAKNMGVQVLFATHEASLLTYADKVIDLTA